MYCGESGHSATSYFCPARVGKAEAKKPKKPRRRRKKKKTHSTDGVPVETGQKTSEPQTPGGGAPEEKKPPPEIPKTPSNPVPEPPQDFPPQVQALPVEILCVLYVNQVFFTLFHGIVEDGVTKECAFDLEAVQSLDELGDFIWGQIHVHSTKTPGTAIPLLLMNLKLGGRPGTANSHLTVSTGPSHILWRGSQASHYSSTKLS